eukprot:158255-Pyramimonas_sp.AAC.2
MPTDLFNIPSIWDDLPFEIEAKRVAKRRLMEEDAVRTRRRMEQHAIQEAKRQGIELIIIDSEADPNPTTPSKTHGVRKADLFVDDVPKPKAPHWGRDSRALGLIVGPFIQTPSNAPSEAP